MAVVKKIISPFNSANGAIKMTNEAIGVLMAPFESLQMFPAGYGWHHSMSTDLEKKTYYIVSSPILVNVLGLFLGKCSKARKSSLK